MSISMLRGAFLFVQILFSCFSSCCGTQACLRFNLRQTFVGVVESVGGEKPPALTHRNDRINIDSDSSHEKRQVPGNFLPLLAKSRFSKSRPTPSMKIARVEDCSIPSCLKN
jgi:hypothetical protein